MIVLEASSIGPTQMRTHATVLPVHETRATLTDALLLGLVMALLLWGRSVDADVFEVNFSGDTGGQVLFPCPGLVLGLTEVVEENASERSPWWSVGDWPRKKKVVALNAVTVTAITAIGFAGWDYGSHSFRTANEGWFDSDTAYGGADKLGHVFTCYALASVYNRIYKDWGYSENDAILIGAASSWLTMSLIEVGDGFSVSEGFSWQDEVMNTLGVGMAYLRHRFPAVRERVDFRWEWFPSPSVRHGERFDILTDYSGQKFLLAFKLDGWLRTGSPLLKAMEVQVGYYTRGYVSGDDDFFDGQHRYGYVGIGLNVTYLLERLTGHRAWGIFDYYQMPYTYLPAKWEYD